MTTGFARGGRLVLRSHIIDTVSNDVDLPHDSPMLHPNRIEGTDFSEFADTAAMDTELAARFPALYQNDAGAVLGTDVLFNGHHTLKVPEVNFGKWAAEKVISGVQRLCMRHIFRLPITLHENSSALELGFMSDTTNDDVNAYAIWYNGDDGDDEEWRAVTGPETEETYVPQTRASLVGRDVTSVIVGSVVGGFLNAKHFVDGALIQEITDTTALASIADITMRGQLGFAATPDATNNYFHLELVDFTPWPDGYPCPFSGLEGLS